MSRTKIPITERKCVGCGLLFLGNEDKFGTRGKDIHIPQSRCKVCVNARRDVLKIEKPKIYRPKVDKHTREKYARRDRDKLSNSYIRALIRDKQPNLTSQDITNEMIEAKRLVVLLKRYVKNVEDKVCLKCGLSVKDNVAKFAYSKEHKCHICNSCKYKSKHVKHKQETRRIQNKQREELHIAYIKYLIVGQRKRAGNNSSEISQQEIDEKRAFVIIRRNKKK